MISHKDAPVSPCPAPPTPAPTPQPTPQSLLARPPPAVDFPESSSMGHFMSRALNKAPSLERDLLYSRVKDLDARRESLGLHMDRPPVHNPNPDILATPTTLEEYDAARQALHDRESALGFQYHKTAAANVHERKLNRILARLRVQDKQRVYDAQPELQSHNHQTFRRIEGGSFLANRDLIEQTDVFRLLAQMPKGAHLHVHFNAALPAHVLLDVARDMNCMAIRTVVCHHAPESGQQGFRACALLDAHQLYRCEIQFQIVPATQPTTADIFSPTYTLDGKDQGWMNYKAFQKAWQTHAREARFGSEWAANMLKDGVLDLQEWLKSKMCFNSGHVHQQLQSASGAWALFNARTRMFKGLFNYKTAYIEYTDKLLQFFVDNQIQYAEIRPNFMRSNQVFLDDGNGKIDNRGIMDLIIDRFERFNKRRVAAGVPGLFGLKIIYCFPRIFAPALVKDALEECKNFRLDARYGRFIAGFDLVGEESAGRPLRDFTREFLQWKAECRAAGVDIPLLLHCGETLTTGADADENLLDALLLGAPRIGHGYALPRHPLVMQAMRARGVCVELCPISNEILGLTPTVAGHSMYSLLANGVPCSLSSDNETIFQSSLTHDFYQAFIGQQNMSLHGLRQLAEWSIEHSVLSEQEKGELKKIWETQWNKFVQEGIKQYAHVLEGEA
ncbi:hypothetical protein BROUX41_003446 [Berkeleyomyces rouxiae]|uniref:uncharacterized protein n=1 Tax=Berkeleyomyces rouxiae TaxID=2035830 RepID=UPI003B7ABE35